MREVSIIGIDLVEEQLSDARRIYGRLGGVPSQADAGEGSGIPVVSVSLHGGDGGVREFALLGPDTRLRLTA